MKLSISFNKVLKRRKNYPRLKKRWKRTRFQPNEECMFRNQFDPAPIKFHKVPSTVTVIPFSFIEDTAERKEENTNLGYFE
jgi:hypothetical protein